VHAIALFLFCLRDKSIALKKNLLKLIFAGIICLLGVGSAKAQVLFSSENRNGIPTANLSYGQTNIPIYGFTLTSTFATTNVTGITLTASMNPITNYFGSGTFQIVRSSGNTYSAATVTPITTATISVNTNKITITTLNENITTTTPVTYYILANYSVYGSTPVGGNTQFQVTQFQSTSNAAPLNFNIPGNNFTLSPPKITISDNNSTGNGITSGSLSFGQNNIVLFGFGIKDENAPTTVSQVVLNASQTVSNYFSQANFTLYKVTTVGSQSYLTGSPQPVTGATFALNNGQITISGMSEAFSATSAASQTNYYFVVANYNQPGQVQQSFQITLQDGKTTYTTGGGNTSTTTTGGTINGTNFTLAAPKITISDNNSTANGITSGNLTYGQNGIVLFGFGIKDELASTKVSQIVLNASQTVSNYFSQASFTLYKVTTVGSQSYLTGSPQPVSGASFNLNNGQITISGMNESFTATYSTSQTNYYFVVANYNQQGSLSTNFQVSLQDGKITYTAYSTTTATTTTGGTINGTNFSLPAPTLTLSGNNSQSTNGITSPSNLVFGQNNVALYGFSVTANNAPTTLNSLTLNVSNGITLGNYFSQANFTLYACNSTNYATATVKTPVACTFGVGSSGSLTLTSINEGFTTGQTKNYFIVANYNINGSVPANTTTQFQISYNTINYVKGNTTDNSVSGSTGTGNNFILSAPVVTIAGLNTVGNTNNGITATNISYGQTPIVMFGFSVKVAGASTKVSAISINSSITNGNISGYFSQPNLKLYVSSTNNYFTGSPQPVNGATIGYSGGTLNITTMNESFTASAVTGATQTNYYFVVASYDVAGSVPGTATFSLSDNNITYTSGATTTSTTTTGGTVTGSTFNMLAPTMTLTGINTIGTGTGGNGISATSLYYGQTGVVLYGFQLTNSGSPTTVTAVNLSTNNPVAGFFTNFKVYSSPTSKFDVTTAQLLTTTLSPSSGNSAFNITGFNEGFTLGQTKYYFIMGDYNTILNTLPQTIKFDYSDMFMSVSNSNKASSNTGGQTFQLSSPIVTISNYNTGIYTGTAITAGQSYNLLGLNLTYTGPTNMHELTLNVSYPSGGDNFTSGYVSSVDLVDATTGTRPSYITYVNNNGGNIAIGFNINAPQSVSTNLILKVTFNSDFSVHKPTAFNICYTSGGSNVASNICGNNSNCTVVNNYNVAATGSSCSQTFVGANIYDWIGLTSTNWATPTNWLKGGVSGTGSIPSGSTDLVRIGYINYTGSNQPDMNGTAYNIGSLEIGKLGSTSSTATATVTLNLKGKDLTVNNGLVVDAGATFSLDNTAAGTSNLNVAGASVMASTSTITFQTGVAVKINKTGGTFVLKSDASGTASIGAIPTNSSVNGTITIQRYFSANRTWRLLSTPFGSTDFATLGSYVLLTGTGGSANGFAQPNGYTANGPSILTYNTTTKKFSAIGSITSNLSAGTGFYMYYRGDNFHNLVNKVVRNSSGNFAAAESVVAAQTGTINQQNLTLTLTTGVDGYNLIGNPYPSSIIMPSGGLTVPTTPPATTPTTASVIPGTTGFVYTYSPGASAISAEPADVTIASGQGFYVKTANGASSASAKFTESLKTTGQPSALLMGIPVSNPIPLVKLKMQLDSAHFDIAYLRFSDSYKKAYNEYEDADDLNGSGQTVFFGAMTSDAHEVAIASQPLEKKRTSVFLSVDGSASGTFKIAKMALTDLPDKYDVILIDHFKKDSVSLRAVDDYSFDIDKNTAASFGNERFEVVIRPRILPPYSLISFTGRKNTLNSVLNWTTSNEYTYTSFALERSFDGKTYEGVTNIESTGKGAYSFTDQTSKPTIYYRLKSTDINDKVSYSSSILLLSLYGERIFSVYPNPNSGVLKFKLNDTVTGTLTLNIYNLVGRLMVSKTFTSNEGEQDVSSYTTGNYIVNLVDSSGKLISSAKFIKL